MYYRYVLLLYIDQLSVRKLKISGEPAAELIEIIPFLYTWHFLYHRNCSPKS